MEPSSLTATSSGHMDPSLDDPTAWEWSNLLDFPIDSIDDVILPFPADDSPSLAQTPPAESSAYAGRARKRDTRLLCENFLAGRVPCACPELDEAAEGEEEVELGMAAKKRARHGGGGPPAQARCQVPGCEVDISELKGYHRRHRVCLRCANVGSVFLEGEAKRYCQQCGKFHVLADFDEGKRSCRRKLERHNKRRRRRPIDNKSIMEKEKKLEGTIHLDVVHEEKKIESTNGASFESDSLCIDDKTTDAEVLLDSEGHGSPFCSDPSIRTGHSNNIVSCAVSSDTQIEERADNPKSMISSSLYENKSMYSTVCPTGRISFKLYDWNPAEFPRRLRLQIFQWLASMPVELEGYIRPGCTILTIFIAMPHLMWNKLSDDTAHYLHHFFKEPQNLFFGRGNIHIYLNNMHYQVLRDGTSLVNVRMEMQVPKLHYVHPLFFEAGKPVEFIVCGSNLLQPKFRFLVSFAGKYLAGETCHVISHGNMRACHDIGGESLQDYEHQIFKIKFPRSEAEVFGPAFIEVENESGLSNFIPVLFADKHICSELQSMQQPYGRPFALQVRDVGAISSLCEVHVLRQSKISELILDVAWLLREPHMELNTALFSSVNIQRVNNILNYLTQSNSVSILQKVLLCLENHLQSYKVQEKLKITGETCNADVELFEKCLNNAKMILQNKYLRDEVNDLESEHQTHDRVLQTDKHHQFDSVPGVSDHVLEEVEVRTPMTQCASSSFGCKDENHPLLADYLLQNESYSCRLQVKTPVEPWDFSRKVITHRLVVLVMASVLVCCGLCAALLHPHMAGRMMVSVRRCFPCP